MTFLLVSTDAAHIRLFGGSSVEGILITDLSPQDGHRLEGIMEREKGYGFNPMTSLYFKRLDLAESVRGRLLAQGYFVAEQSNDGKIQGVYRSEDTKRTEAAIRNFLSPSRRYSIMLSNGWESERNPLDLLPNPFFYLNHPYSTLSLPAQAQSQGYLK